MLKSTPCAGMKNILRAGLLALLATFLGCAVLYTIPDTFVTLLNRHMPYWFYDSQVIQCPCALCLLRMHGVLFRRLVHTQPLYAAQNSILCIGTAVANWLTTAFYR